MAIDFTNFDFSSNGDRTVRTVQKKCENCDRLFFCREDESWKTVCITCYRERRNLDQDDSQLLKYRTRIKYLQRFTTQLEQKVQRQNQEIIRLMDRNKSLMRKLQRQSTVDHMFSNPDNSDWVMKNLMGLIRLCHPDRHDNSNESNEITKHLTSLLNKRRRK